MAKLVVVEGVSRTGKTTICNYLQSAGFGKIVSVPKDIKMPDDLDLYSYYRGMFVYSREIFKNSKDSFILDRSFLSELVYSKTLNRTVTYRGTELEDFLKENEIYLFMLTNSYDDYLKRNPADKTITYTKEQYESLLDNFDLYFNQYSKYVKKSERLNTSRWPVRECIDRIVQSLIYKI